MNKYKTKFIQAANQVFQILSETVPARTFFIASTSNKQFVILEKFNKVGGCTIPNDPYIYPLEESYCSIVAREARPLFIRNTSESMLVKDKDVTTSFSIGSYLGVPIILDDGTIFGTLCALDPMPHVLEEKHTKILEGFASLIANSIELEQSISELREHEIQTENEFQLAQKVQQSLFSKPMLNENIAIESIHLPSSHLSGDLFSWQKLGEGRYGVIILDVMGHDVSSALIGMMVFSQLKKHMVEQENPYEVMNALNQDVIEFFKGTSDIGAFVTGIYIEIDTNNNQLTYMNAGHPPAILIQDTAVQFLTSANMPLGITDNFPDLSETIHLNNQEFNVLLYTDGLLDLFQPTDKKVLQLLKEIVDEYRGLNISLKNYLDNIISAIDKHPDDICVLSIQGNTK
ncbi:sigma-B regulation protein RsbU (phosphoserine phosphatase) [Bacillus mesophilus]|uniref:SpoIIE family protein phosphatase n=1 Tax=Bacillus mesophilus TaxID=1808955 RepID=A0A6M0Q3Q4_9BACI|nr:GAF domain-containing SpoIIE family protein phosphatase [Bacillus mesophilus]MBM7659973.1 sigma-B regulation protein RsbU (phosphoserine phosphatase) [Bacillus mesophilus]NEY70834.1 SpoIIE family protein phosphatase [Bacillus mesophilus]